MKYVQPMLLSKNPVKRYDNRESRCESYMPAAHGELPNSVSLTVPKPLEKLKPPSPSTTQSPGENFCPRLIRRLSVISLAVAVVKLSPTSNLDMRAVRHNLLRGGNSASGMSSLRSPNGGMNSDVGSGGSGGDGNGNGNDVGTGGGKYSDDGRGGSGGVATHLARRSSAKDSDSKMSGDGGSVAVTYACHLVNRLPLIAIDGKTPFEKVYGKPAIDYDSLHVLGSATYYHVKELKLDPSAKKALFMQITSGIKAQLDLELVQIDVKTALLHGGLKEEIYMVQLEGFKVAGKVHEVYDMLIASQSLNEIEKLKIRLKSEFQIKHLDEQKMILGMEIVRDRKLRKFCLTQKNI
nr:retrovirus-related Pol polyprotein from transposon TNT 1-94 [Tanacetum cinerariifolium]